ncbi:DUF3489 domain-containing protein [Marinicaulis aureus]|uniref:DUF3489 domain-containing protein n=1 Tax=Hyphococcus aureus TaxID=2666033 RepID=A0ABW1KW72_9PROT
MARKTSVKIARKKQPDSPAKKVRTVKSIKPASAKSVAKKQKPGKDDAGSKKDIILDLLRRKDGASVAELAAATGWQKHSVRGFLSGTVKKKLSLPLDSDRPEGGERRYFLRERS